MAYILKNKKRNAYIRTGSSGGYFETDDPAEATQYQGYKNAIEGVNCAAWYADIDASIHVYNGKQKEWEYKS